MSKAAHPTQQHPVQTTVEVVPATTSPSAYDEFDKAVSATKKAAVAIIIMHVIAVAAYGFYFQSQISISIIAIVVSSVVLRGYEKQAYATAAVVYSLGVVADVWRVIEWKLFIDYLNDSTDDSEDDTWIGKLILIALPSILGAIAFLIGAVCAIKAIRKQHNATLPI